MEFIENRDKYDYLLKVIIREIYVFNYIIKYFINLRIICNIINYFGHLK